MRIIGGKFRGHNLSAPKGLGTRPTTDRTRESLFNILANRIDFAGKRVIDIFAGSGALGLEAISRGADFCMFVEETGAATSAIRANILSLNLEDATRVSKCNVTRLGSNNKVQSFNLAFADPPYGKKLGERAARVLRDGHWLADGATFVLEESTSQFPPMLEGFDCLDQRRYGDTTVGLFEFEGNASCDYS